MMKLTKALTEVKILDEGPMNEVKEVWEEG
jgi:hypothetical protein